MFTAPRAGFVLAGAAGAPCAEMLPLAAVLVGAGSTGACASCKSFFESRSNTAQRAPGEALPAGEAPAGATAKSFYESRSNTANRAPKTRVSALAAADTATTADTAVASWDAAEVPARAAARAGHEVVKGAIRNLKALKALYAVAPSGGTGEGTAAFTIDQKGVKLWEFTPPGGSPERLQIHERPPSRPAAWVALEITETPSGCLMSAREPDLFDLASAMQAQKPRHVRPEGKPGLPEGRPGADAAPLAAAEAPRGPLSVGRIPEEVLPGTTIALQYVDLFGDVVVDVPAVAGTEVVPRTAESAPPCVTAATAFAQAEDTVCVCGNFPGVAAQAGLWIDERHAGHAASLATRTMQVELPPHARTPGRHVWSGDPAAGYLPSCRAWTQVVQIAGAIDSQRLFSSESTPMRLTVAGTTDRVPLEIRNLTPGIVRIDGGERQTVESSGGTPNTVTRSVQGLVRGDFKIEWSLAHDRCPCP
jgi:hypothetical protein